MFSNVFSLHGHSGVCSDLVAKNLNLQPKMTRLDPTMAEVPMSKTSYVTFLSPFSLTGPSLRD